MNGAQGTPQRPAVPPVRVPEPAEALLQAQGGLQARERPVALPPVREGVGREAAGPSPIGSQVGLPDMSREIVPLRQTVFHRDPTERFLAEAARTAEAWAAEACRDAGLDRCGTCGRKTQSREDHLPRCPARGDVAADRAREAAR